MIGFLHTVTGDYPAAAAELRQALELFCDLGHRRGQGDALTYLGEVHRCTGDYPAAAACHRQALELLPRHRYRSGQADALMSLGTVQQLTGDYPAAAATLRQALALSRDLGDRLPAGPGSHRARRGAAADRRLPIRRRQQPAGPQPVPRSSLQRSAAYALNELGLVQQLTGDYPAAAASHQQALELCRDPGDQARPGRNAEQPR